MKLRYLKFNPWLVVLACWLHGPVLGQGELQPAIRVESTDFAPGTVTVIPPEKIPEETFTGPITLRQFLDSHPEIAWRAPDFNDGRPYSDPRTRTLTEMAQQVILRREVFCLEFSFKPLRTIYVDIPQPNGRLKRKLIWYLVYRVRYQGNDLRATSDPETNSPYGRIEGINREARRFFPIFTLVNHATGAETIDQILPAVKAKIATLEKITAPLYNTVEISSVQIPRSSDPAAPGVWGLATWEDLDPGIDFLSVYVRGLTNAFRRDEDAEGKIGLVPKVLRMNFYRPGDRIRQTEDRIYFGLPAHKNEQEQAYFLEQYGLQKRLDYEWVYR